MVGEGVIGEGGDWGRGLCKRLALNVSKHILWVARGVF